MNFPTDGTPSKAIDPPLVPTPNKATILAALRVLFDPADVVELRVLRKGRKAVDAGYFDSDHFDDLADYAMGMSEIGAAVYIMLNPVAPQLLSRYANRLETNASLTTTDKDVTRRRWLLIDLDPVRPSGTSATATQLEAAADKARDIHSYLLGIGWPLPLTALSGNGYHLLYALDLPNDLASTALVKGILVALAARFDDEQTKVDPSVFNAARICKLYGTVANKGDHTASAPHRLSYLMDTPARVVVTVEQLAMLQPPAQATTPSTRPLPATIRSSYLEDFFARHSMAYTADMHNGSERFKLAACPIDPTHVNGEAAVFRKPSGELGFKCQHSSCSSYHWKQVRELLDGPTTLDLEVPWPELQDLVEQVAPKDYPLDALPDVVRCAVREVADFVKAPIPLIATSALAALSLAIQAHTDVARAEKLSGPTSLFLLAIADSGERKSSCDGYFTKAIRDYEAKTQEVAKPLIKAYESEHEAWKARRSGVTDTIKSLAKGNKSSAAQTLQLHDLDLIEPASPRVPRLVYGDATPEALTFALAKKWPSGGVISSEAGTVFGGHGMGADSVMRNLATLNQLWDGATLPVERRSSESFTVRGARLTMALQVQEITVRTFFANSKGLARGTGFLARFLVSWPESTQGTRHFTEAAANWPALATFNDRLTAILKQPAPIDADGALNPAMLTLAPDAKAAWVAFHNAIESELSSGGELYDVRDVASKTADNAARLAALFHTFTGNAGPIGIEAMLSATRVTAWHLHEAQRFLGALAMPTDLANAVRLEAWMLAYCGREQTDFVPTRVIRQFITPVSLRAKAAFESAMSELEVLGRARLVKDGKKLSIQLRPEVLEVIVTA
jgi:putative DNA primase/helicase